MAEAKLLDSNILVYAFDASEPKRHKIAQRILSSCLERKEKFYIAFQNISEFYHVVTSKIEHPLPHVDARIICKKLLDFSGFVKISPSGQALIDAMALHDSNGIPYWDALLAATMRENKISTIYTENTKDFKKVSGLKVINPFG